MLNFSVIFFVINKGKSGVDIELIKRDQIIVMRMDLMVKARQIAIIGLLVSIGLCLHLIEAMLPLKLIIPGAKIGLANIVILIGLVLYGFQGGGLILLLRLLLTSILAGTLLTINFYLSLTGGVLSFAVMYFLYTYFRDQFSLVGISVAGAVSHNLGQLVTSYLIIDNPGIFYYWPYLVLLAVPTGISVGLVSHFSLSYLPADLNKGG